LSISIILLIILLTIKPNHLKELVSLCTYCSCCCNYNFPRKKQYWALSISSCGLGCKNLNQMSVSSKPYV